MRLVALSLALLAALVTAGVVYLGSDGLGALAAHLLSVTCIILTLSGRPIGLPRPRLDGRAVLASLPILLLVALQLALARYFGSFPLQHFHQDEFETAYASYSLPSLAQIQWFAGYPDPGLWVASFPSPFFVLQKPFFMLLGPTVDAVRISVWPYLALTIVYLYLLAREVSPLPAFPIAACLAAMLFAPSLYIDSLGVHFHGATLFLVASLYYVVRLLKTARRGHAIAAGVCLGFAYLGYPASYITLPLVLGFVAFEALLLRSTRPLRLIWPALVVWAFVLLPFVVYAFTKQNYFFQRVDQINAIGGSEFADPAMARVGAAAFLLGQLWLNLQSLVEPGIVIPGYSFGRQALFEWSGAVLFALGLVYGGLRVLRGGPRVLVLVAAALASAFLSGMVLMPPTGAFHRITLVFPLVGLVVALGLLAVYEASGALLGAPRSRPTAPPRSRVPRFGGLRRSEPGQGLSDHRPRPDARQSGPVSLRRGARARVGDGGNRLRAGLPPRPRAVLPNRRPPVRDRASSGYPCRSAVEHLHPRLPEPRRRERGEEPVPRRDVRRGGGRRPPERPLRRPDPPGRPRRRARLLASALPRGRL